MSPVIVRSCYWCTGMLDFTEVTLPSVSLLAEIALRLRLVTFPLPFIDCLGLLVCACMLFTLKIGVPVYTVFNK